MVLLCFFTVHRIMGCLFNIFFYDLTRINVDGEGMLRVDILDHFEFFMRPDILDHLLVVES